MISQGCIQYYLVIGTHFPKIWILPNLLTLMFSRHWISSAAPTDLCSPWRHFSLCFRSTCAPSLKREVYKVDDHYHFILTPGSLPHVFIRFSCSVARSEVSDSTFFLVSFNSLFAAYRASFSPNFSYIEYRVHKTVNLILIFFTIKILQHIPSSP